MTITYQHVAERTGIAIPDHLIAQAEVPTAANGWRQGDVFVMRWDLSTFERPNPISLIGTGHKVVAGEADRNSHVLNGDGTFYRCQPVDRVADYGILEVPAGGVAVLTHTGEHGSVAFGEGVYRVWGQVSYETELRRAAD